MIRAGCMRLPGLLALMLAATAARADRAYFEPAAVHLGDITQLVIEYENRVPSLYALDTTALERDFELLGKDSRLFRMDHDGQMTHRMQWRLQLTPRRSGRLSIPPIRYGERSTPTLELEVTPRPEASPSPQIFIEIDSERPNPYVGQQVGISLRLYHDVPLFDARLEPPKKDGLQIRRATEESRYRVRRGEREFELREQQWLLFPRRAGQLSLPPATLRGAIAATQDPLRSVDGRRRIFRRSEALSLEVRPPPDSYGGRFWLPATRLEITQTWSGFGDELRVGDTLEWSHVIVAHGLPAEALPADLALGLDERVGIYPDQAQRSSRVESGSLIGRLEQRYAVIVTEPGRIELPAIRLLWWDVEADRERSSVLEGRVFEVSGGARHGSTDSRPFGPVPGMLALLLLLSLALAFVVSRSRLAPFAAALEAALARRRARQKLKKACLGGDPAAARAALIAWARSRWPAARIVGLRDIGARAADAELALLLAELDAALYAPGPREWRGRRFWRLFGGFGPDQARRPARGEAGLPPLYPDRDQDLSVTRDQPSTGSKRSPKRAA